MDYQKNMHSKMTENNCPNFGSLSIDSSTGVITIDSTDYVFIKRLGSGASSTVVCLREMNSSREVALKGVNKLDEAKREMFALKELHDVFGIAKLAKNNIFKFNAPLTAREQQIVGTKGQYFLVLERYKCDLLDFMASRPQLSHLEATTLFYKVLRIVNEYHSKGIHNADIKPENIFLVVDDCGNRPQDAFETDSEVELVYDSTNAAGGVSSSTNGDEIIKKLLSSLPDLVVGDFGVFNPNGGNLFGTGSTIAPEQAGSEVCNRQVAEVWQLGVLFFSLLYYDRPFGNMAIYQDQIDGFKINHPMTNPIIFFLCTKYDFSNFDQARYTKQLKQCFNNNFRNKVESDDIWNILSRMIHPDPAKRAAIGEITTLVEALLIELNHQTPVLNTI